MAVGQLDSLEVKTFASEPFSLVSIVNAALNYPDVSHPGQYISACAIPRMDVKRLSIPTAGISWWMLKISSYRSPKIVKLLPTPWLNSKFLSGLQVASGLVLDIPSHQVSPNAILECGFCLGSSIVMINSPGNSHVSCEQPSLWSKGHPPSTWLFHLQSRAHTRSCRIFQKG